MIFSWPATGFAWGVLGHRVVGGIADKYLTAQTSTELKKLLGNESLAMASNWADFIKSDRNYDYLDRWHYINLPASMTRQDLLRHLNTDTGANLYSKTNFLIKQLRNAKLSRHQRIFYLKLLIHLVGDAHQPMHTARPGDRGGNNVKVYWFNAATNLHRVWDEHLVEFQQLSYTEYVAAINFPSVQEVKSWQRQPLSEWIYESYQVAEMLYSDLKSGDRLSYSYNYKHVETMNRQLLKGGIRLAGILNDVFGKTVS